MIAKTESKSDRQVNNLNRSDVFCAVLTGFIVRHNGSLKPRALARLVNEYTDELMAIERRK